MSPSGDIAVARSTPFRVDWWVEGAPFQPGIPIQYSSQPVTPTDRAPYDGLDVPWDWPEAKPPFHGREVLVSDGERVFIHLHTASGTSYQLVDREGQADGPITLSSEWRIVAATGEFVAVVQESEVGLFSIYTGTVVPADDIPPR